MDYNLWYDRLGINNLTKCNNINHYTKFSFIPYYCTLLSSLNYLQITNFKINDESSTCIKNIYPVKLGYYTSNIDINIDDIELFYSKFKDTDCEILFFYPHEIFFVNDKSLSLFENIRTRYRNLKIKLLSGDLRRNLDLPSYVKHISFDYFFYSTLIFESTKSRPILNYKKKASKDFIFLNGRFQPLRALMQYDLIYKENLTNLITSFHGYTSEPMSYVEIFNKYLVSLNDIDQKYVLKNYDLTHFRVWLSKLELQKKDVSYCDSLMGELSLQFNDFYRDTYLDLVSETFFDSTNALFITEKTYRPIAYGMIFLVCGQHHTLKHLKSRGFETFENLFDESYDEKLNWSDRWNIIKDNLFMWINLSDHDKKMYYRTNYDKLKHNQKIIYTFDQFNDIKKLIG